MLDIDLGRNIVEDGVIVGVLSFGLLQLVHQRGGVLHAFFVGGVQALGNDLVHDEVFACGLGQLGGVQQVGGELTPVGDDGLELLELDGALGEAGDVGGLQALGHFGRHGGGCAWARWGVGWDAVVVGAADRLELWPRGRCAFENPRESISVIEASLHIPSYIIAFALPSLRRTSRIRSHSIPAPRLQLAMVSHKALAAAAVAAFFSSPALAAMYPKNSPVLQVEAKDYSSLIAKSNHTSVSRHDACTANHADSAPDCRVSSR